MKRFFVILILGCFIQSCSRPNSEGLDSVSGMLISGSVPVIETAELADQLSHHPMVLLDAREKDEYLISHIPNARWVGFETFDIESVKDLDRKVPVVVYCSVGYRSEKIGEKLKAAGFTDVKNLFGGIFKWANQGRSLEDLSNEPTRSVHGFNSKWSRYLSSTVDAHLD